MKSFNLFYFFLDAGIIQRNTRIVTCATQNAGKARNELVSEDSKSVTCEVLYVIQLEKDSAHNRQ